MTLLESYYRQLAGTHKSTEKREAAQETKNTHAPHDKMKRILALCGGDCKRAAQYFEDGLSDDEIFHLEKARLEEENTRLRIEKTVLEIKTHNNLQGRD